MNQKEDMITEILNLKCPWQDQILCDHSEAYILFKGITSVKNVAGAGAAVNNTNKVVTFKNYVPFTDCITEINYT